MGTGRMQRLRQKRLSLIHDIISIAQRSRHETHQEGGLLSTVLIFTFLLYVYLHSRCVCCVMELRMRLSTHQSKNEEREENTEGKILRTENCNSVHRTRLSCMAPACVNECVCVLHCITVYSEQHQQQQQKTTIRPEYCVSNGQLFCIFTIAGECGGACTHLLY